MDIALFRLSPDRGDQAGTRPWPDTSNRAVFQSDMVTGVPDSDIAASGPLLGNFLLAYPC